MKLQDIKENYNRHPLEVRHAFFRKASGPEDMPGVELSYIQSRRDLHAFHIMSAEQEAAKAESKGDDIVAHRANRRADSFRNNQDKTDFYLSDLGWWKSEASYQKGDEGFNGVTKKAVENEHPDMRIYRSREQAVEHFRREEGMGNEAGRTVRKDTE